MVNSVSWFIRGVSTIINKILDRIYIGDVSDMSNVQARKEIGIGAVLNCGVKIHKKVFLTIRHDEHELYWHLPIYDGEPIKPELILSGIQFIKLALQLKRKVLIGCAAGISRSVAITLAYMIDQGWGYDDGFLHIKKKRPCANPDNLILLSIREYFNLPPY